MSKNLRLKRSREYVGLSQEQLAEKIGSTRGYIAQLEASKEFSYKKVVELSRVLGLNPAWLETGSGVQFLADNPPIEKTLVENQTWLITSGHIKYSLSADLIAGIIHCQSLTDKHPDFDISLDEVFRVFTAIKGIK